jgi:hypothetical protein
MRASAYFGLLLALLVSSWCELAVGQAEQPLVVLVEPGDSGLSQEEIRSAIARELRVTVVNRPSARAAGTLNVRIERGSELYVRYRDATGRELSRVVDLPASRGERLDVIALLAGNLARNEATTLAESLRPKPETEADAGRSDEGAEPDVPAPRDAEATEPARRASPANGQTRRGDARADDAAEGGVRQNDLRHAVANASLFFPLAVFPDSHRREVNLELGLAYGRLGALHGVGSNLVFERVEYDVSGVLVSGIASSVGGHVRGLMISGVVGMSGGDLSGVEVAGVANLRGGGMKGVQMSSIVNRAAGDTAGVQASLVNIGGNLDGVQFGLVNVAQHVRGAQFGLVNVADEVDGLSFGLANVIAKGKTRLVAWADSVAVTNAGVKYVMGPVQSLVTLGWDPVDDEGLAGVGLGAHFELGDFFVEPDVLYRYVVADPANASHDTEYHSIAYRVGFGWQPEPKLGVLAGGGLEQQVPAVGGDDALNPYGFAGLQFF